MEQPSPIIKYQKAYGKILAAQNILLVTHYNPDGDGLSSLCLMIELLENLGKKYLAYCYDEPALTYSFLPHWEKIHYRQKRNNLNNGRNLPEENAWLNFSRFDLIIVLDCGSLSRTKLVEEISRRGENQRIIEFDHHPKMDNYADLEIRDPQAAATAEIIYHFLKANKIKINRRMAGCLLVGIMTDTANFLYPSTSEQTVKIAAEMLALGARLPQIIENTLRNKSLASLKIWGKIMSNLQINPKYNFAVTVLTLKDINTSGAEDEELEGISNFLGNLYGVKGVLLLREEAGGFIRGNLRTAHPEIDLNNLAKLLGGGGHAKAAGFTLEGRLEKTEKGWKII